MAGLNDVIAAAIRAERSRRRLTQAQLADLASIPRATMADIESGQRRINLDNLPAVCAALEVSLLELVRHADADDLVRLGLRKRDVLAFYAE